MSNTNRRTHTNILINTRIDRFATEKHPHNGTQIQVLDSINISTKHGAYTLARSDCSHGKFLDASRELGRQQRKRYLEVNGDKIVGWI